MEKIRIGRPIITENINAKQARERIRNGTGSKQDIEAIIAEIERAKREYKKLREK